MDLSAMMRLGPARIDHRGFQIDVGEIALETGITLIRGSNGSGKSTLLRAILGLIPGPRLCHGLERARHIGFVPQTYRDILFPWLTVSQQLARLSCNTPVAERWLGDFGLSVADLRKRPYQLSGGQAQRVAVSRECNRPAQLLLLDEPFSSMDARSRETAVSLIAERARSIPTILVTHIEPSDALKRAIVTTADCLRVGDSRSEVVVCA